MIVYACSREASATTGAALRVEGGIVESVVRGAVRLDRAGVSG